MTFTEYINQTTPQKIAQGSVILEENDFKYFFTIKRDPKTDKKTNVLNIELPIGDTKFYYTVQESTNFLQCKNGSISAFKISGDLHDSLKSKHQEKIISKISKYL